MSAYGSLRVFRLDPSVHALLANERVVAKQDFLSAFDAAAQSGALAYVLTGISGIEDLLLWQCAPTLERLHTACARLQSTGLGKYLRPTRSYLGLCPQGAPTGLKHLSAWPLAGSYPFSEKGAAAENMRRLCAQHHGVRAHAMTGLGLEGGDALLLEFDQLPDYLRLAAELRGLLGGGPASAPILGLYADIQEIVDSLVL